jgi:hypothetical protein
MDYSLKQLCFEKFIFQFFFRNKVLLNGYRLLSVECNRKKEDYKKLLIEIWIMRFFFFNDYQVRKSTARQYFEVKKEKKKQKKGPHAITYQILALANNFDIMKKFIIE